MLTSICEECMEGRGPQWIEITTYDSTDADNPTLEFGFCSERHAIMWLRERAASCSP